MVREQIEDVLFRLTSLDDEGLKVVTDKIEYLVLKDKVQALHEIMRSKYKNRIDRLVEKEMIETSDKIKELEYCI